MQASFIAKLNVRDRGDTLSAVCAEVPGLHIYGKTYEAIRKSALLAIPRLLKSNRQMEVEVSPTDDLTEIRVKPK